MENNLEIILVTYNRVQYLKQMLASMFVENSPALYVDFIILDNASDDDTKKLCEEYQLKYGNIKYIRWAKNIGGNANIARAFELAKKEYVWIVCDDDVYDFSGWKDIENAIISNKYDIILTMQDYTSREQSIAKITKELTFLPSGIYKTSNLTSFVLQNIFSNIPNVFPHLAVVCYVINKRGSFYLSKKNFISKKNLDNRPWKEVYLRGLQGGYISPIIDNMFWMMGYLNSIEMISDIKLKACIINGCGNSGFFFSMFSRFRINKKELNNNLRNICNAWCCFNFMQRIQFAIVVLLLDVIYMFRFKGGKKYKTNNNNQEIIQDAKSSKHGHNF